MLLLIIISLDYSSLTEESSQFKLIIKQNNEILTCD